MLYQTDIYTAAADISDIRSELSVKIHGAAMKAVPAEYAEKMHEKTYHPFSIFTVPNENGFIIRVSALCDEAKCIVDALSRKKTFRIFGMKEPLSVTGTDSAVSIDAATAGSYLTGRGCRITFITPAMIKKDGKPSAKPDISAYFQSVVKRYNAFENADISYDDFLAAFNNSELDNYELRSEKYNVSGHIFPGMTGYCDINFPKKAEQADLLKKVIAYGTYSGIGGKTGMGMGGITAVCFR